MNKIQSLNNMYTSLNIIFIWLHVYCVYQSYLLNTNFKLWIIYLIFCNAKCRLYKHISKHFHGCGLIVFTGRAHDWHPHTWLGRLWRDSVWVKQILCRGKRQCSLLVHTWETFQECYPWCIIPGISYFQTLEVIYQFLDKLVYLIYLVSWFWNIMTDFAAF